MRKRRIIAMLAVSADGFIARPDGNVDWLNRYTGDYGMRAFFGSIDTILWGRKTYDHFVAIKDAPSFGPTVTHHVFSRKPPKRVKAGFEFVREPLQAFVKRLRSKPGKDIWMMGGGGLIASFLDAGQIDEFILSVIPVFIGKGIPLIHPRRRETRLKLLRTRKYPDGIVTLHYQVTR